MHYLAPNWPLTTSENYATVIAEQHGGIKGTRDTLSTKRVILTKTTTCFCTDKNLVIPPGFLVHLRLVFFDILGAFLVHSWRWGGGG